MNQLINYIKTSLNPKDSTEFYEGDVFDPFVFSQLKQDGFMILKNKPPQHLMFSEYIEIGDYHIIKKCVRDVDWLMKDGSYNFNNTNEPLYRRLLPPPDEAVNHCFVISSVISVVKNNFTGPINYIEYGVRDGKNINPISELVDHSYGVDLQDCPSIPENCKFYKSYTDDFSRDVLPSLNYQFAFIDADHKFQSCFTDFKSVYKYLKPNGYIFLHDTYPCDSSYLDPMGCYDCYKTPIEIKKHYPNVQILTLPLHPGVTIIKKL